VQSSSKRARLANWLEGDGIEIGALHNPLEVPPTARVRYVDHLPVEALRSHYPELDDLPLVDVDVIGSAENLSGLPDASVDFVIANHLLEHLEDPLAGLLEFQRVLKPGKIIYLALPDQRLTFDRDRELTSLDHLLREHCDGSAEANRWSHYLDWSRNVGKMGSDSEAHAADLMRRRYSIHFHVWRPDTFLEFFYAARRLLGLDLEVLEFAPPETPDDIEFIIVLGKSTGDDVRLPPRVRHAVDLPPAHTGPAAGPARTIEREWRQRLARSPLGPPVRAVRRAARRLGGPAG
jgi:SAM-dependent methyltransferase